MHHHFRTHTVRQDIAAFHKRTGLIIPRDLEEHFVRYNVNCDQYDDHLFRFYPLDDFHSVEHTLGNWGGSPDYSNLINTLPEHLMFFVFADYLFSTFSYAIKLYPYITVQNEVFAICGDAYHQVAESFSRFMDIYRNNPEELQF
jgi:predicted helicase